MSIVNVFVSAEGFNTERRFDKSITIEQLKAKIEILTGITPSSQRLSLYNGEIPICSLEGDDTVMLGAFPVENYMRIHAIDINPSKRNQYTDVSLVEKYEIPEEEYAKRSDSVLAYMQRNKMGRFHENAQTAPLTSAENTFEEEAKNIKVGDRCEIDFGSDLKRRGTIKFVGLVNFKPGFWVGVQYDEPLGKNDGSVGGERYFTCPPNYGAFVRPNKVIIGDFPEDEDLEEM